MSSALPDRKPLQRQLEPVVAFLKYSGSLLVYCKNGNYFFHQRARLALTLFIFICNFQLMMVFEELLTKSKELLSAKTIVLSLSRMLYQVAVFTGMYIVLFKTPKVALILNEMAKLHTNVSTNFPSNKFVSAFSIGGAIMCSSLIFAFCLLHMSFLSICEYVTIEVFILSLTFQTMLAISLTFSFLKSMNTNIIANIETSIRVLNLRESHEKIADLYEDIQATFGFFLTVTTFGRCTYFVQDVNEVVARVIDMLYYPQREFRFASSSFIIMNSLWAVLDIALIFAIVVLCSKVEIEVR